MIREFEGKSMAGLAMVALLFVAQAPLVFGLVTRIQAVDPVGIVGLVVLNILVLIMWFGLFIVNPNEARVLQLFGRYTGTVTAGATEIKIRDAPGVRQANRGPTFFPMVL